MTKAEMRAKLAEICQTVAREQNLTPSKLPALEALGRIWFSGISGVEFMEPGDIKKVRPYASDK